MNLQPTVETQPSRTIVVPPHTLCPLRYVCDALCAHQGKDHLVEFECGEFSSSLPLWDDHS